MIDRRRGARVLAISAGLVVALVVVAWLTGFYPRAKATPTLEGVDGLLRSERFDDAERLIGAFLRVYPDDDRVNLLMAQVALGRADQKPSMALEHLAKIRAVAPTVRALVLLNEGKAYSSLGRYEQAEASWLSALRINPQVPEAGWALLGTYYVQDRRADSRRLGLALHAIEPDPRDRVQLLMELLRQDAKPIVGFSVIKVFEPVVREHPEETHAAISMARALIHEDRPDDALPILERLVARDPKNPGAWEVLLLGLDEATRDDAIPEVLGRIPGAIATEARFARFRGIVAKDRSDWETAAAEFRRARQYDPSDPQVAYRLSRALRLAGLNAEAERADADFRMMNAAGGEALALYDQSDHLTNLGVAPRIALYRRISDLRERMGHRAEALAWQRLILLEKPDDPDCLAAVTRLADVKMPLLSEITAAK